MERSHWIILYPNKEEELVIVDVPESVADQVVDNGTYSEAVVYAELAIDEWVETIHQQKHTSFEFQKPFARA